MYYHKSNVCVFAGNYVLNYLATQPKLPNFVIQALVTLFARISKLGWFDSDKDEFVFRNVVTDVAKFLQVRHTHILHLIFINIGYFLSMFMSVYVLRIHTWTLSQE